MIEERRNRLISEVVELASRRTNTPEQVTQALEGSPVMVGPRLAIARTLDAIRDCKPGQPFFVRLTELDTSSETAKGFRGSRGSMYALKSPHPTRSVVTWGAVDSEGVIVVTPCGVSPKSISLTFTRKGYTASGLATIRFDEVIAFNGDEVATEFLGFILKEDAELRDLSMRDQLNDRGVREIIDLFSPRVFDRFNNQGINLPI